MKSKKCTKCKSIKLLSEFSKDKTHNDGLRNHCKNCRKIEEHNYRQKNKKDIIKKQKTYCKKYPWKKTFSGIKNRCNNSNYFKFKDYGGRGIKCLITKEELKKLWFRDKAYLMKKPSIDREDNNGNYELSNCRFIEKSENSKKDKYKIINQYNLTGKFIKQWPSLKKAANSLNIFPGNISHCINSKRKSTGGFIWQLAK